MCSDVISIHLVDEEAWFFFLEERFDRDTWFPFAPFILVVESGIHFNKKKFDLQIYGEGHFCG